MASSLIIFILFLSLSSAQNDVVSVSPSPSSPARFSPFRPSIAVIVGVFTTIFSIIFLLLLYAKHCVNNNSNNNNHNHLNTTTTTSFSFSSAAVAARKNSGIDRAVVESLPVFRFGSLLLRRSHSHHYHLDCAVCLCRFDDCEVLRLLPKCRHAFHVECVDTWLDAHSTCPLCRFRVDPEDVLLTTPLPFHHHNNPPPTDAVASDQDVEMGRRVSGRHSSAGERRRALFQMVDTASFRRSLDSWSWRRKRDNHNHNHNQNQNQNQSKSSVAVGCFDRKERKDGLLLTHDQRRRLEHRIIVSPPGCGDGDGDGSGGGGIQCYNDERWSDVQPSDLLYLRSEMIMSDSRRFSSSAGAAAASSGSAWAKSVGSRNDKDRKRQKVEEEEDEERSRVHNLHSSSSSSSSSTINGIDDHDYDGISGRRVINTRSVSEITGLTRFSSNDNNSRRATNDTNQQRRQQGLLRRWLAWVSQLRPPQQEMV